MNDEKNKQEPEYTYEDYERDPIACGYTLIEEDGKQFYTKTVNGDGFSGTVKRPVLTPEERKKREKQIEITLASIACEMYREDPELADRLFTSKTEEEK